MNGAESVTRMVKIWNGVKVPHSPFNVSIIDFISPFLIDQDAVVWKD